MLSVCVFGLGEAGSEIARDIATQGVNVNAFDPAPIATPTGVIRHAEPGTAVLDVDLILAVTAGGDSEQALRQALDEIPAACLYADLASASPKLKGRLADVAAGRGVLFADVALMATVPGRGVRTPALASGTGAEKVASVMGEFGMPIDVVAGEAGVAAGHKLVRSVVMKSLAAALIESVRASDALGIARPSWDNLVGQLGALNEEFLIRLIDGTGTHHVRRREEMQAAFDLLTELGVEPAMTTATLRSLDAVAAHGVPSVPPQ